MAANKANRYRQIVLLVLTAAVFLTGNRLLADTYTDADTGVTFNYPQRWHIKTVSAGVLKLTAPDGYDYLLKFDSLAPTSTSAPINDPAVKKSAGDIAAGVVPSSTLVKGTAVTMDHGHGATYRFKSVGDSYFDIWCGFVGKHSVELHPARAGQPGQAIGISVVFQSLTFADATPTVRTPPVVNQQRSVVTPGSNSGSGTITVQFNKQILPVLEQRCANCHSSASASGGFDATSYAGLMAGGEHGSLIVPGNPAQSMLIDYLTGVRDQMPKGSAPLTAEQINLIRTWIREGATRSGGGTQVNTIRSSFGTGAVTSAVPVGVSGEKPMESYEGHLAVNDSNFKMRIYTGQTVTADWSFDKPYPAHLRGTYTTSSGIYNIHLELISGSIPGGSRSLHIVMLTTGTDVVGKFSTDTSTPRNKVMGLQLAELDNARKGSAGANSTRRATTNRTKQQKNKSASAQIRRENRQIKKEIKQMQQEVKQQTGG